MKLWNCSRWMVVCLALTAVVSGPFADNPACAQKPKTEPGKTKGDKPNKSDGAGPESSMAIAKVEGRWDAFSQGIIKILNAENKEVFLHSDNDTLVTYKAEAEPAWLMPGYMVRFSASFDQNSKATAPLKAIEVFTPRTGRRMSPEEMREQTPGITREDKPQLEGAKAPETDKKPPKGKPAKKDATPAPGQTFRVVGQIGGIQNNVLTVLASTPIQIEIDPAAVVTVTSNDLVSAINLIVKGDGVVVSGLTNPAQPSQVYCEQITIKAGKKLTTAMPQAKRGKPNARDKDNDSKNSKNAKDGKDAKDSKAKPDPKKATASDK